MNDSGLIKDQLEMSRNFHDTRGIDKLRRAAQSGDKSALKEAAQQFEAIFVQMMLKSMRKAQDALADKDSPFNTEQVKFYRDMHDQQLAVDLSSKGSLGLADIITQQLDPQKSGVMPASAIRSNGNLADIRKAHSQQATFQPLEVKDSISGPAQKLAAFTNQDSFVRELMPYAQEAAKALGIDPKAMLAQAAVETGWGKYIVHEADGSNGHNLFGIKADNRWQGDKSVVNTIEYKDGIAKTEKANFRRYDSFLDSMKDYVSFVTENPRYQKALQQVEKVESYFSELQQAGYATDPDYANKILSVLQSSTFKNAVGQVVGRHNR